MKSRSKSCRRMLFFRIPICRILTITWLSCSACEEISQRLASLKTFDASAATRKDVDLASATTSMDLDAHDTRQSDASRKPASSVKEKARARMLQRLKELEEP